MKNIFKNLVVSIITWQSRLVLKRYHPKIIAITGSVGKTSTKDAIFTVISEFKTVRKSEKSYNSEIGLPLTILGLPNGWNDPFVWFLNILHGFAIIVWKRKYPEYLILEVGVGKPGDIVKNVVPWLRTDMVIITSFPDKPVHVEFFGSVEKIIEEKSALVKTLKKDGVLVLNHDDDKVYSLHQKFDRRTISFGFHDNATYHAVYPTYLYKTENDIKVPEGINFKLEYEGNSFPVTLPYVLGMHNIGQALAAIACAKEIGCDLLESIEAVSDYKTPPGRLSYIEGMNSSVIIDDTYNSSPVAAKAAIEVLKDIEGKRKIAVLGDMLELGRYTEEEHRTLGEIVCGVADVLVIVGPRSKFIGDGALEKGFKEKNIIYFDNSTKAGEFLKGFIKKSDVILMKGSQGVRLERAVEAIMAYSEQKKILLCRQDKEWRNR